MFPSKNEPEELTGCLNVWSYKPWSSALKAELTTEFHLNNLSEIRVVANLIPAVEFIFRIHLWLLSCNFTSY
jgi:hypothetical protein